MGSAPFQGSGSVRRAVWTALIVVAGSAIGPLFACATPFAALATLAAVKTERRDTALAVGLVWLLSQVTGYAFLGYPWRWNGLAWSAAVGIGAGMGLVTAIALAPTRKGSFAVSLPFVGAFAAYEFTLYLASFVLPADPHAFTLPVVREIFIVNAVSLAGLTVAHWLATMAGLLADPAVREVRFSGALSAR